MKVKQIAFTEPKVAALRETILPNAPAPNQVLIKTAYTTISCGTEKANLLGDPTTNGADPNAKATFPRVMGYNCSGIVAAKGEAVKSLEVGDRVVGYWSAHQSYNLLSEKQVVKIEDEGVDMQSAAMSFIATFPMAAIRKTRLEIGEPAMVMGLGILGLIGVALLRSAGAMPIIAADPIAERREKALKFGADYALDPLKEGFAQKVKELTDGGVAAAIEVTGVGAGLDETLDCMRKFGRIALLGCTRDSHFEIDYYHKVHYPGIQLIGAHTHARPEDESHPGYFTHRDDIKAVLKLCAGGRLNLRDMIDEVHNPADCSKVYDRMINDKNYPVVTQFDWGKIM